MRTFIVELEDTPETYKIGIGHLEQLSQMFTDAKISFDFKTTITAKVPEKDVKWFLKIATNPNTL